MDALDSHSFEPGFCHYPFHWHSRVLEPHQICGRAHFQLPKAASLIEKAEVKQEPGSVGSEDGADSCKKGTLVFNPKLGVTVLYHDAAAKQFPVVNFSSADGEQKRFAARVSPVLSEGKPYILFLAPHEIPAA